MSLEPHRLADAVAVASIPANAALWLVNLDLVLRIGVSMGSLVLIGLAIMAKLRRMR